MTATDPDRAQVEPGGRWPWIVVAVAGAVAVASITFYWLNRPEWAYCVDGEDWGYCDVGVFSSNAIIGTILVALAMLALLIVAWRARGERRRMAIVIVATIFAVALIAAWVVQIVPLEQVQIPNSPDEIPK